MRKMNKDLIPLTHPGEHLLEMLEDYGLTQYRLAKELGIQQTRVMQIIKGERSITADSAIRLGRFFGTSAEMWMNLQQHYDLEVAQRKIGLQVDQKITPLPAARAIVN
jgi:addiction module HigA family antidote